MLEGFAVWALVCSGPLSCSWVMNPTMLFESATLCQQWVRDTVARTDYRGDWRCLPRGERP